MTFDDILDQILDLLQRQGTSVVLGTQKSFDLHDDDIAGLKDEIITAQRLAVDEDGKVLVWIGQAASAPATVPAPAQDRAPLAYTPPHLTEKILHLEDGDDSRTIQAKVTGQVVTLDPDV